jgi:hypothetical protein
MGWHWVYHFTDIIRYVQILGISSIYPQVRIESEIPKYGYQMSDRIWVMRYKYINTYKYQEKCSAVFLCILRKFSVLGSHKQSFSFQLPASTWHERWRWRGACPYSPKGLVIPVGLVEKICRKPGEPWLSGSASNSLGFPADFPYQSIEFSTVSYSWWSLVKGVVRNPLLAAAFNPTQFLAKHWHGNIV